MASPTPSNAPGPEKNAPAEPPEEGFWIRYSPHNELPLSGLGSFVLHMLLFGAVLFLFAQVLRAGGGPPLPIAMVDMAPEAGGGGSPEGVGDGPGNGVLLEERHEAVDAGKRSDVAVPRPAEQLARLDALAVRQRTHPIDIGPNDRTLEPAGDPLGDLRGLQKQVADTKLPPAGYGKEGSGRKGGAGIGNGPDRGPGDRSGDRHMTPEQKRAQRRIISWEHVTDTEWLRQLKALDAVLAVRDEKPNRGNLYHVYRDLSGVPLKGRMEDIRQVLSTNDLIWYIQDAPAGAGNGDDRQMATRFGRYLGINVPHGEIVTLLPTELNKEMLKKELAFKHAPSEDDIESTVFQVVDRGGKYDVVVKSQTLYSEGASR